MKIVRVADHNVPVGVEAYNCYGPFTDEEAWTFADKVDEAISKRCLSKKRSEIMDVNPPREFIDPTTGEPLKL